MINSSLLENTGFWLVDFQQTVLLKEYPILIGWFSLSKSK